jgi:tetratricopeptide (TPR) repeat protein
MIEKSLQYIYESQTFDVFFLKSSHMLTRSFTFITLFLLLISCSRQESRNMSSIFDEFPMCGTVQFTDACGTDVDSLISLGLALIHHMTFEEAEVVFDNVIATDENCFWGYWGKAMTYIHPLWPDIPSPDKMKSGIELSQKALNLASNEREAHFGKALFAYYSNSEKSEKERLMEYHKVWAVAFNALPSDLEVKAFFALTLLATADPTDKSYSKQLQAGALAEEILNEIPDHPAGFHYTIHSYDYPTLGPRALKVAQGYGKIAPEIPHALHMPTHIFTRLGLWHESIDWNRKSADAALKSPFNGEVSHHYFHALDYIVYAYLQTGQDDKALAILDEIKQQNGPYMATQASAYSLASVEARCALEQKDWEWAKSLKTRYPDHFPWDRFPENEALTHFAKGLGAARSGDVLAAKASVAKLEELKNIIRNTSSNEYWAHQIDIQETAIQGWIAYALGEDSEAISLMQKAKEMEFSVDKHPVTPGYLLPAAELNGDLLMEMGKPGEALIQYEYSLETAPRRLNTLYGAAKAALESGDKQKATQYFKQIEELTRTATVEKAARTEALEFLQKAAI